MVLSLHITISFGWLLTTVSLPLTLVFLSHHGLQLLYAMVIIRLRGTDRALHDLRDLLELPAFLNPEHDRHALLFRKPLEGLPEHKPALFLDQRVERARVTSDDHVVDRDIFGLRPVAVNILGKVDRDLVEPG